MKQLIYILLFSLSLCVYSQNFKLIPNVNPLTNLEQRIEKDTTLVLRNESVISKVRFYDRFTKNTKTILNNSESFTYNLNKLDLSTYSVMVYSDRKIIVFTLEVKL